MTAKRTASVAPDGLIHPAPIKRRSLLHGMGGVAVAAIGAAVVGADAVAQPAAVKQAPQALADASQASGYRLTDHIRAYYQTTRL
ncbi:MAG: hypothetical protein JXR43_06160 [Burkholderiaceae bacterium]|nr:hypothetical protein [Burkholderiaceae bacterium]